MISRERLQAAIWHEPVDALFPDTSWANVETMIAEWKNNQ